MTKPSKRDINSALALLNFHCNFYRNTKIAKTIKKILKNEIQSSSFKNQNVKTLKAYDNGRVPTIKQLKNPIIIAQYKRKKIILDGNHRVLYAQRNKIPTLPTVIINLSPYEVFAELEGYNNGNAY